MKADRDGKGQAEIGRRRWLSEHWFGLLTVIVMVVGTIALAGGLLPHRVPVPRNPSVLDSVFASRGAVLAVRLALLNGSIFLVASILVRTYRGDWIFKVGPVETTKDFGAQQEAVDDLKSWKDRAERAETEITDLKDRVKETTASYQRVFGELEACEQKLATRGRIFDLFRGKR